MNHPRVPPLFFCFLSKGFGSRIQTPRSPRATQATLGVFSVSLNPSLHAVCSTTPQEPLRGYNEVIVGRCYLACYPTVPLGWMKPVHRTQPHGGTTLTTERTRPPKRRIQAIHVHMVCFEWFKSQVQAGRGGTLVRCTNAVQCLSTMHPICLPYASH